MKSIKEVFGELLEKAETDYDKFFKKTLKKYGVDEPDKLSKEDKNKFFDEIDAGWDAKTETD